MKKTALAIGLLLSTTTMTLNAEEEKKYDCSASETANYIKVNTASLQMPSSISKPKEFTESLISTKKKEAENNPDSAEEAESCFNIWSGDVDLDNTWENLKKKFSELDFSFDLPSFSFSLDDLLKKAGAAYDKALGKVEEELSKGICERLANVNWKKLGDKSADYFGGKIDDKYGFNPNDEKWWETPLKNELNGEMDNLGDYVFDPNELKEDINDKTKRKIKEKDDDFWNDI